jgi:hypothetical protein
MLISQVLLIQFITFTRFQKKSLFFLENHSKKSLRNTTVRFMKNHWGKRFRQVLVTKSTLGLVVSKSGPVRPRSLNKLAWTGPSTRFDYFSVQAQLTHRNGSNSHSYSPYKKWAPIWLFTQAISKKQFSAGSYDHQFSRNRSKLAWYSPHLHSKAWYSPKSVTLVASPM